VRDLTELRDELRDRDGPTEREMVDLAKLYRAGVVSADDVRVSLDRWGSPGWGDDGGAHAHPSPRPRHAKPEPILRRTAQTRLSPAGAALPEAIDHARERLSRDMVRWLDTHGYVVTGDATWETELEDEAIGARMGLIIRLTIEMAPRTDGEWPAIHQAIAEDEADRVAAESASTSVDDRLDALRASAAVWAARTPVEAREALRKPEK
jgi:hypothetical protein